MGFGKLVLINQPFQFYFWFKFRKRIYYKNSVTLFPNPVCDLLTVESASEIKSVEIYNLQGQKITSANQKQINVSDLSNRIYLVKIQDNENSISIKKIIKN